MRKVTEKKQVTCHFVVGADGLKSRLRGALLGDGDPRPWPEEFINWVGETMDELRMGYPSLILVSHVFLVFLYVFVLFSEKSWTDLVAALRIYFSDFSWIPSPNCQSPNDSNSRPGESVTGVSVHVSSRIFYAKGIRSISINIWRSMALWHCSHSCGFCRLGSKPIKISTKGRCPMVTR